MPLPNDKPKKKIKPLIEDEELRILLEEFFSYCEKKGKVTDLKGLLQYAVETVPLESESQKPKEISQKKKAHLKMNEMRDLIRNAAIHAAREVNPEVMKSYLENEKKILEKEMNSDMKDKMKKPVKKKSLPTMWPNGLTSSLIVEGMIESFPYQRTATKEELKESAKRIFKEEGLDQIAISMTKENLIDLLKDKDPQKYKKLEKLNQLEDWAESEMKEIRSNYKEIMDSNPNINSLEARELAMEGLL